MHKDSTFSTSRNTSLHHSWWENPFQVTCSSSCRQETEILHQEISQLIKYLSTGKKATGTDGFSTEIFKLLELISSSKLFRIFNDVFEVKGSWNWTNLIDILSPLMKINQWACCRLPSYLNIKKYLQIIWQTDWETA